MVESGIKEVMEVWHFMAGGILPNFIELIESMLLIDASEFMMNAFPWYAAELFLKVCEAGGLSAAAQSGLTGISQPALSTQMIALERHLGKTLFERRPFVLTAEGRIFRDEAARIRAQMSRLCGAVADDSARPLRIAASDVIIRDHLPALLKRLDAKIRSRLVLREAPSQELSTLVRNDDVDLAIGLLSKFTPAGPAPMVEKIGVLPIVLHVPPSHQSRDMGWQDVVRMLRRGEAPGWVGLPQDNLVTRHLAAAMRRIGVGWEPTLEVSSMGHIPTYVDLDFGFGFGFDVSGKNAGTESRSVIHFPRDRMPPLHLVAWHRQSANGTVRTLLKLIRSHAMAILKSA